MKDHILFSINFVRQAAMLLLMFLCGCQNMQIKLKTTSMDSGSSQGVQQIDSTTFKGQHSLIRRWKMNEVGPPGVQLPNFFGVYRYITLDFQNDSVLKCYLEGRTDSIADYQVKIFPAGFKMYRGDVVSSANVELINPSNISISGLFRRYGRIVFNRIK